jgi:ABC-2 type transport system permease protein
MLVLLAGLTRRNLTELRRYGFDTATQLISLTLLFTLLFYGVKGIAGPGAGRGHTQSAIVAGYGVFALTIVAYSSLASWVTNEATLGTLEQVAMSPFGLLRVLLLEFVAGLAYQLALLTGMVTLAMALTRRWLHFDAATLVPLLALHLLGVLGIGLALAGAALVFKRVASLMNLMQFVLLALIAAPLDEAPALRFLPITMSSRLLSMSTVDHVRLWHMGAERLAIAVLTSTAMAAIGLAVFRAADRAARARGVLGVH